MLNAQAELRWTQFDSSRFRVQEDGTISKKDDGYATALGSPVIREGTHVLTFKIVRAKDDHEDCSGGILLGVYDADALFDQTERAAAVGLDTRRGLVFGPRCTPQQLNSADLRGKLSGALVSMKLDMEMREVWFSINGIPWELRPLSLGVPAAVRPWVRMAFRGDVVKLVEHRRELQANGSLTEALGDAAEESDTQLTGPQSFQCEWQHMDRTKLATPSSGALLKLDDGYAAAFGSLVMAEGLHFLTYEIVRTKDNFDAFGGISVGVIGKDAAFQFMGQGDAVGLHLYSGQVFGPENFGRALPGGHVRPLQSGNLRNRANDATVRMRLELDKRMLSFSINGGPWETAPVAIPSAVRPWARLCCAGDMIKLSDYKEGGSVNAWDHLEM